MEAFELTADAAGEAVLSDGICWGIGIECGTDVSVAEAVQVIMSLQEGFEEGDVFFGGGVEAAIGVLFMLDPAGTQVQKLLCGSRIVGHGQSREVVMIGRASDLCETRQAGNALGHGEPPDDAFALTCAMSADEKAVRIVDDRFDAEDQAELVVHFDPVSADPMFDAHTFDTGFEVFEDVGFEVAGEFLAEEAQDILSAEAKQGVFNEFSVEGAEGLAAVEEYVGGEFGLIDSPIVSLTLEEGIEQRVDLLGEGSKEQGPILMGKCISQSLSLGGVGDLHEGIVDLLETPSATFHLSGEPVMAVDGDLDDEREPALQSHMNETQFGMQEVVVQTQAFTSSELNAWTAFCVCDFECGTRFQLREHADQSLANVVSFCDAPGLLVFSHMATQVLVRAAGFGGRSLGVIDELVGVALHEASEILNQKTFASHEFVHSLCITDLPQVSLENHPIKTFKSSCDICGKLLYKLFHGVLPELYFLDDTLIIRDGRLFVELRRT